MIALPTVLALALPLSVLAAVTPERRGSAQLITSCTVANTAALTFDDGPYIYTKDIVDAIKAVGGKATFFVNGNNWGCIFNEPYASNLKYAYDNGFQIGSHTWAHKDLTTLDRDALDSEMSRTEDAIQKITGAKPAFTRPPFGSYNDLVLEVAGSRSQTVVNWDFDSGDSMGASADTQKQSYTSLASSHPNSILSLEHEVYDPSVHDVLPAAIQALSAAGYQFVTVADCLGQSPYLSVGEASVQDGTWTCSA